MPAVVRPQPLPIADRGGDGQQHVQVDLRSRAGQRDDRLLEQLHPLPIAGRQALLHLGQRTQRRLLDAGQPGSGRVPESHDEGHRLLAVEQQGRQLGPDAQPVPAAETRARLDRVTQRPQSVHVAAYGPLGHLETIGQVARRPVPADLQQTEQPEQPSRGLPHACRFCPTFRTSSVLIARKTEPMITTATSIDIRPFTIAIEDTDLDDLHERLARTRFPAPLPGDDWDTGVPVGYLRELVDYWQHAYDWRQEEARLNRLPQFLTEIDGQQIHFVHVRSDRADATPLLLTHGWPGSFVEFLELIDRLRGDFHLVVPSLPGFAFSGPVTEAGWDTARIARAWVELMDRLGYERFGVQGGDIGAAVSPEVGRVAPDRVTGVHVNGNLGMPLHGPG